MPRGDQGCAFARGFWSCCWRPPCAKLSSATLLSIDNSGSNPCFVSSLAESNAVTPKLSSVTAHSSNGLAEPWEQPPLPLQTWLCSASATSWGHSDGTTVTLPTAMHSFKEDMDLSHNPAQRTAHAEQADTYTLLSHWILQGNVEKTECNCSVCSHHVCQSRSFQLSRRPLRVASCQSLCFLSHLTHDSYSSKEPQAPCS